MDPDKALKFLSENLTEWSRILIRTLLLPAVYLSPTTASTDGAKSPIALTSQSEELWLNPKLLWFSAFSAILGTMLNGMLPGRVPAPSLLASTGMIVISWFFYGTLAFAFCRIFRGKADYLSTLSLSLQVSATLYVLVSFISLLVAALIMAPFISNFVAQVPVVGAPLVAEPALTFFLVGAVLTSIYQPLSLRRLHRLGWFATALLTVLPYFGVWFSIAVYRVMGIMLKSVLGVPAP